MQHSPVILDDVTFSYDDSRLILKNVSLEIKKGQTVAIMGGSGSGKTTVLKLISGQIKPTTGKVIVFGKDISDYSSNELYHIRKKLGMLFQFGALFTDMTVFDNIAFTLNEHTKLPKEIIKKIVAMKLKSVGLFGTQSMYPQELSGGMARRVALARAIVMDPELVLYDEPFTGLDPISLNTSANLIKMLNDELGQTSILVSHDIETTFRIVDYVYFMADGQIVGQGTPLSIKETDDPLIRQFLTGSSDGKFNHEFVTKLDYHEYLGIHNG